MKYDGRFVRFNFVSVIIILAVLTGLVIDISISERIITSTECAKLPKEVYEGVQIPFNFIETLGEYKEECYEWGTKETYIVTTYEEEANNICNTDCKITGVASDGSSMTFTCPNKYSVSDDICFSNNIPSDRSKVVRPYMKWYNESVCTKYHLVKEEEQ